MRLGSGGDSVTLTPVGYQFPTMKAAAHEWDWDANWLVIRGEVRSGELAWTFRSPCMTTREARELGEWLEALVLGRVKTASEWLDLVVHGRVTPGDARPEGPAFVEPNVSVCFLGHADGETRLEFAFSQESSPPGADEDIRYGDGHPVTLSLPRASLAIAAGEWATELESFPER